MVLDGCSAPYAATLLRVTLGSLFLAHAGLASVPGLRPDAAHRAGLLPQSAHA